MATSKQQRDAGIPPLEWAAALLGCALVLAAVGLMLWLGLTRGDAPPQVTVRVESISPVAGGYAVAIRAINTGATTAADVTVEGELRGGEGIAETSSMSFKYLAPQAERRGGLFFAKDPRKFELEVRAKGYETP
jgi:uncharacterized protein (TIGR02588 family)